MEEIEHSQPERNDMASRENPEGYLRQFENLIAHAPVISPVDRSKAPFREYAENTKKEWHYVQPDKVDTYLKEKFFFDINDIPYEDIVSVSEIDISDTDKYIQVPLDLVVFASGFKDWRGRGEDIGKTWISEFGIGDQSKSLTAIKHYAGLSTKLPAVTRVDMYKQPDGKVFFF